MQIFLIKYGLLAVFVAAMVDADVIPILTGVVAHLGYVKPGAAILAASGGALAGDCLWFGAGLYYSESIRCTRFYRRIAPMAESLVQHLGLWQIPASHVIYGTRIATMIFWGIRRFSFARFALIDSLGCVAFTTLLFTLGFGFSAGAEKIIGGVKRVELLLLVVAAICVLILQLERKFLQGRGNWQEQG
jgi:membrane protein DedA with SNARE-associated domain